MAASALKVQLSAFLISDSRLQEVLVILGAGAEDKCDNIKERVHSENQAISLVSQVKNEEVRRCRYGLIYGSLGKGKIGIGG